MGTISNSINHYLSDNRRFADLFNGICFQGETVVRAEDLSETSQVYHSITGTSSRRRERICDICSKQLRTGVHDMPVSRCGNMGRPKGVGRHDGLWR